MNNKSYEEITELSVRAGIIEESLSALIDGAFSEKSYTGILENAEDQEQAFWVMREWLSTNYGTTKAMIDLMQLAIKPIIEYFGDLELEYLEKNSRSRQTIK